LNGFGNEYATSSNPRKIKHKESQHVRKDMCRVNSRTCPPNNAKSEFIRLTLQQRKNTEK